MAEDGTYSQLFEVDKKRRAKPATAGENRVASGRAEPAPSPHDSQSAAQDLIPEIRLTVPLRADQVEFLDGLEREVNGRRSLASRRRQRITRSSIIRAWLTILRDVDFDRADVRDEDDLFERLRSAATLGGSR